MKQLGLSRGSSTQAISRGTTPNYSHSAEECQTQHFSGERRSYELHHNFLERVEATNPHTDNLRTNAEHSVLQCFSLSELP